MIIIILLSLLIIIIIISSYKALMIHMFREQFVDLYDLLTWKK